MENDAGPIIFLLSQHRACRHQTKKIPVRLKHVPGDNIHGEEAHQVAETQPARPGLGAQGLGLIHQPAVELGVVLDIGVAQAV